MKWIHSPSGKLERFLIQMKHNKQAYKEEKGRGGGGGIRTEAFKFVISYNDSRKDEIVTE